jgi:hypothetical protein
MHAMMNPGGFLLFDDFKAVLALMAFGAQLGGSVNRLILPQLLVPEGNAFIVPVAGRDVADRTGYILPLCLRYSFP